MGQTTGKSHANAAAFKSLMGDFRRVGYLFGSLNVLPDLLRNLAEIRPFNLTWVLTTTANTADFVYFICDNLSLLANYGIVSMRKSTNEYLYDDLGTRVWVLSSVCWLWLSVLEYMKAAAKKETKRQELFELRLAMLNNACNLFIGWYYLFPDRPFSSNMAALMGVVSAVIGLRANWK